MEPQTSVQFIMTTSHGDNQIEVVINGEIVEELTPNYYKCQYKRNGKYHHVNRHGKDLIQGHSDEAYNLET